MPLVLALLVFLSVSLLVLAVGWQLGHDPKLGERLERVARMGPRSLREIEMGKSLWERVLRPGLLRFGQLLSRLSPQDYRDRVRRRLLLAGSPWNLQASEFLAIKGALTIGLALMGFFIVRSFIGVLIGGLLGWLIPDFGLKAKSDRRQVQIQKSLPDTLDLLCVSVEAGLGFDAAVAKVVEKSTGPLAEEFGRLLQEIRMGKPRRAALKDMAHRSQVEDLSTFITAIIQADQLGVSIGNVLNIQSQEMRRKRRQRAEEAAMKAPIKMLFPLIFFIFPALFVVLLGPALIQIMEALQGML
ncbi:MAG: type II secretion system F family protein [Limnochordia bacterium]|jgi:tight adherence protein C|nr:type II secretion system F family protein [Bacillota bacterium]